MAPPPSTRARIKPIPALSCFRVSSCSNIWGGMKPPRMSLVLLRPPLTKAKQSLAEGQAANCSSLTTSPANSPATARKPALAAPTSSKELSIICNAGDNAIILHNHSIEHTFASMWGGESMKSWWVGALIVLMSSFRVHAEDWPQWQGPARTNISKETGLLKSWPADGPKLLWTYRKAGLGYSGPAIVGDHLYTMGARGGSEVVIVIDGERGKVEWGKELGR